MAYIQRKSPTGMFKDATVCFLIDVGFVNIASCLEKSVWACNAIQIELDLEEDIINYRQLFEKIYNSGMMYGAYIERKKLVNATTQFIINYGKTEKTTGY